MSFLNQLPILICCLTLFLHQRVHAIHKSEAAAEESPYLFSTSFEQPDDISKWSIFDEIVTTCYGEGISELVQLRRARFAGKYGMGLYANRNKTMYSNHVIAGLKVSENAGLTGRWLYKAYAYIPANQMRRTQTGPEISIQNTRQVAGGGTVTSIGGVQYIPNPWVSTKWLIWAEVGGTGSGQAAWIPMPQQLPELAGDTWYELKMVVDLDKGRYGHLRLAEVRSQQERKAAAEMDGPNTANTTKYVGTDRQWKVNNVEIRIADEVRGFEPACVITLEGENLYNNCGSAEVGPVRSQIYYDKVQLKRLR